MYIYVKNEVLSGHLVRIFMYCMGLLFRYNYILDKMPIESNRLMRVKNLTNLANILGQDLSQGAAQAHTLFQVVRGVVRGGQVGR